MIPARLSFRYEFTPFPSCGSVFVYMIPAQNLIPERVTPVRVHPGNCTGARFSFRYERQRHVNAVRPFAPAWNHYPGSLEWEARAQSSTSNLIWRHNRFGRHKSVPPCKHGMKSQCHTGIKLAPVRVFTCKHPLTEVIVYRTALMAQRLRPTQNQQT